MENENRLGPGDEGRSVNPEDVRALLARKGIDPDTQYDPGLPTIGDLRDMVESGAFPPSVVSTDHPGGGIVAPDVEED